MSKIIIKENGEITYKNMSEECILSVKKKMGKAINTLTPSFIRDEDIKIKVEYNNN